MRVLLSCEILIIKHFMGFKSMICVGEWVSAVFGLFYKYCSVRTLFVSTVSQDWGSKKKFIRRVPVFSKNEGAIRKILDTAQ